jgi:hypothetical protein
MSGTSSDTKKGKRERVERRIKKRSPKATRRTCGSETLRSCLTWPHHHSPLLKLAGFKRHTTYQVTNTSSPNSIPVNCLLDCRERERAREEVRRRMSDCVIKLFGKRIPFQPVELEVEEEREEEKVLTEEFL